MKKRFLQCLSVGSTVAGLLLLGSQTACKTQPPAPPAAVKATPISIPFGVMPPGNEIIGYLSVRDAKKTMEDPLLAPVKAKIAKKTALKFNPGQPIGVYWSDPGTKENFSKPELYSLDAVFPFDRDEIISKMIMALDKTNLTAVSLHQNTFISRRVPSMSQPVASPESLLQTALAGKSDVTLYANVERLVARYGDEVKRQADEKIAHQELSLSLQGATPEQEKELKKSFEATKWAAGKSYEWLKKVKAIWKEINLRPDIVEYVWTTQKKTDSDKGFGPLPTRDLTYLLPMGMIRGQFNFGDFSKAGWSDAIKSFYGMLYFYGILYKDEPILQELVTQSIPLAGNSNMAFSVSPKPENVDFPVSVQIISLTEDPQKYIDLTEKMVQEMSKKAPAAGLKMENFQRNVRKIKGWSVHQITCEWTQPEDKKKVVVTIEMMQLGPYVVMSVGTPIDGVAERIFSADKKPSTFLAANRFPAGGFAYVDVHVLQVANLKNEMVNASELPPEEATASLFAYQDESGNMQVKVQAPRKLLNTAIGMLQ